MIKSLVSFVVILFILSPLPAMAAETSLVTTLVVGKADGVNKPKKSRKKKKAKPVKQVVVPQQPYVDIVRSADQQQVIINWYRGPLPIEQSMQQSGATVVPFRAVSNAFDDSKDKQFAERFVKEFNTTEALFLRATSGGKPVDQITIALNRDNWSDSDMVRVRDLLLTLVSPSQPTILPNSSSPKQLLLPTATTALAKSP